MAPVLARLYAVMHGVLHQRLEDEGRKHHAEHLGGDPKGDGQPVAEPSPLEVEVGVDEAELFGHRHELAVGAKAVADEVGELDEQLAGPVGI